VGLPDPERSRVVLIGTGRYTDEKLPDLPVVENTVASLEAALTDPRYGVVPKSHCVVLLNEGDIRQLGRCLRSAAKQADDLLLVYYAGHGLVAGRRHELYLGLPDSEWIEPEFNSLEYDKLRGAILDSPAATKIMILDCCFSGRVVNDVMAGPATQLASQIEVDGTYVLTSAQRDQVALVVRGEEHTAFTGRFLRLLRDGVPGGPEFLTIDDLYLQLLVTMKAAGLPEPQKRATRTADLVALTQNRAFVPPLLQRPRPARTAIDVPAADDGHYRMMASGADKLVVFLGARVNSDDREEPWSAGSGMPPDDRDLARYLASRVGLENEAPHLAEVAQYVVARRGELELFDWVRQALVGSAPGPVHRYLAQLPARLGGRFQMIVTSQLDVALERAFTEAGQEFDVAIYMAPGTEHEGKFVHVPWEGRERLIDKPNVYTEFPIVAGGCSLRRTVIVRTNGAVDDLASGFPWEENYVITDNHYIGYMSGGSAEEDIPGQILAKLRRSNYLFLGYAIDDWRHRVFLQRIWKGLRLGRAKYWAVEHEPDALEKDLWNTTGVQLYRSSLTGYFRGLYEFIDNHPGDAQP